MKKFLLFATVLLAALACQKQGTDLTVSSDTATFDSDGGFKNFVVDVAGEWTVSYDNADWFTVSNTSDNGYGAFAVVVEPNTSANTRSAELTVKSSSKEQKVTIVQPRPAVPENPEEIVKTVNKGTHTFTVDLPAKYDSKVVSKNDFITVKESGGVWTATVAANGTGAARTGVVAVTTTDDLTIYTVKVNQSDVNVVEGDLVIEEVYFAGTLLPNGRSAGDQYIKITNNTDETVYADGLLFCMSSYHSQRASTGSYWVPQELLTDKIGVSTLYAIPGSGSDVAVGAGESLVIAITAEDYSENGGPDLSKADFEIYVDFYGIDTDNPDVPNMELWAKASASVVILHGRGYESYALVMPPSGMTAETLVADYPWVGKEDFILFGEYYKSRDILAGNYALPNDWVIDGVNCGVEQFLGDLAFNASVDAGYTGCGVIDSDPDRFGKSARRIYENGRYVDTDNSTNDFERDAELSLK